MPDPITTTILQVKTAAEIIRGLLALKTTTEVNAKAIELQGIIIDLQSSISLQQLAHDQQIKKTQELEKKIVEIENWVETTSNYVLESAGTGVFVYKKKPSIGSSEPPHWICANCVKNRKKSILQNNGSGHLMRNGYEYFCPECKTKIYTNSHPT